MFGQRFVWRVRTSRRGRRRNCQRRTRAISVARPSSSARPRNVCPASFSWLVGPANPACVARRSGRLASRTTSRSSDDRIDSHSLRLLVSLSLSLRSSRHSYFGVVLARLVRSLPRLARAPTCVLTVVRCASLPLPSTNNWRPSRCRRCRLRL